MRCVARKRRAWMYLPVRRPAHQLCQRHRRFRHAQHPIRVSTHLSDERLGEHLVQLDRVERSLVLDGALHRSQLWVQVSVHLVVVRFPLSRVILLNARDCFNLHLVRSFVVVLVVVRTNSVRVAAATSFRHVLRRVARSGRCDRRRVRHELVLLFLVRVVSPFALARPRPYFRSSVRRCLLRRLASLG